VRTIDGMQQVSSWRCARTRSVLASSARRLGAPKHTEDLILARSAAASAMNRFRPSSLGLPTRRGQQMPLSAALRKSPNPAQPELSRLPGLQAPDLGLQEEQFLEPGVWSLKSLPSCTRSRAEGTIGATLLGSAGHGTVLQETTCLPKEQCLFTIWSVPPQVEDPRRSGLFGQRRPLARSAMRRGSFIQCRRRSPEAARRHRGMKGLVRGEARVGERLKRGHPTAEPPP
jgi:hypothetical protein